MVFCSWLKEVALTSRITEARRQGELIKSCQDLTVYRVYPSLRALYATLELEKSVETALGMVDTAESLIVVTADHAHSLAINGYPKRGSDIRGYTGNVDAEGRNYTTLSYGNGPGIGDQDDPDDAGVSIKKQYPVTFRIQHARHGGSDVGIWATGILFVRQNIETHRYKKISGPLSYLFHSTHEQSHVGHVLAYALCGGPYQNDCGQTSGGERRVTGTFMSLVGVAIIHVFI